MREILESLNDELGVKGSLVMSPDGVVVTALLGETLDEEAIAALVSMLLLTLNSVVRENELETFDTFVLAANYGKLVVVNLDHSYLVVITDQFIKLDLTRVEIASAAERIRKRGRLSVS
ncbi:MAG: roadblock/LC7 domain-containing protein [Planctomycetota bacterium]